MRRVVVVGASLAGMQAAQALRRDGYDGELVLVGEEPHYPYDRPPLSKAFLAGTLDVERLRLRPALDPGALGIDWRLGQRAVGLELGGGAAGGGRVHLEAGGSLPFDGLVIATGARPRSLPAADGLEGVHLLRTLDDSLALRAAFDRRPARVAVIGAGFIGAEVAATARGLGLEVTIIEAAEAPLARVLDAEAGLAVAELHRRHGVEVLLGAQVTELASEERQVGAVLLADGTTVEAPVVVVGIGVVPNTAWLDGSGLTIDNGVVADQTCLAAPGVVVAGDVARWPNRRFDGQLMRVEQWDNAIDMGSYAGRRLLAWSRGAAAEPFEPVPWFWSDQYDRKIQLAGISGPSVEIVQGSLDGQQFVRLYAAGAGEPSDELVGALCWNRPRQAILARQLIAGRASLADGRAELG
jgi:NADPH-dependent 2,4-dienoyl-CoA reductase/sulfur reductase-like enzyme